MVTRAPKTLVQVWLPAKLIRDIDHLWPGWKLHRNQTIEILLRNRLADMGIARE